MISIPINVHHEQFLWYLDLFWFNHKLTYGDEAAAKAYSVVISHNSPHEKEHSYLPIDVPHEYCKPYFLEVPEYATRQNHDAYKPINIQLALNKALQRFDDEQVIEVLDHDMFHFRKHPEIEIQHDQLFVCDIYEDWHLKSLSDHRNIISIYFENSGKYYNGGFVPIIGTVKTFKKIMYEWIAVHDDILKRPYSNVLHWWAGMYALSAACEKKKVQMIAKDFCYIPNVNDLKPEHYIAHYSVDSLFDKRKYPNIDVNRFKDNEFYSRIKLWPNLFKTII